MRSHWALPIDFQIHAPDATSASEIHSAVTNAGYVADVEFDEGEPDDDGHVDPDDEEFGPSWTVYAKVEMIPTHDEIIRIQADLVEGNEIVGSSSRVQVLDSLAAWCTATSNHDAA